jgi:hypothetical protein
VCQPKILMQLYLSSLRPRAIGSIVRALAAWGHLSGQAVPFERRQPRYLENQTFPV